MTSARPKLTILVDDSEEMTTMLSQALADHGFQIEVAKDLKSAHAMALDHGVVISDTRVPALTLREIEHLAPACPTIVMVSCALDAPEPPGIYFLLKPFELRVLFEMVSMLMSGKMQDNSVKMQDDPLILPASKSVQYL